MGERGGGRDTSPEGSGEVEGDLHIDRAGRQVSLTLYSPGVVSCELWTFPYRAAARFLSSVLTLFRVSWAAACQGELAAATSCSTLTACLSPEVAGMAA